MRFRIFFSFVTLFFLAMNVLLWRSEFSPQGHFTTPVPAEVVWRKLLTAPENSRLAIAYRDASIGYCTWAPNVSQSAATGPSLTDERSPEGMVKRLTGYTLDVDGNLSLGEERRLKFSLHLRLNTNQALEEFVAVMRVRPEVWELRVNPAQQTLHFRHDGDGQPVNRDYRLSDPRHLESLVNDVGLPLPPGVLATMGLPFGMGQVSLATLGLEWETRNDWLQFRNARLRVYRVDVRLLGKYRARLFISPVGEIIRIELPPHILLYNDGLMGLQ